MVSKIEFDSKVSASVIEDTAQNKVLYINRILTLLRKDDSFFAKGFARQIIQLMTMFIGEGFDARTEIRMRSTIAKMPEVVDLDLKVKQAYISTLGLSAQELSDIYELLNKHSDVALFFQKNYNGDDVPVRDLPMPDFLEKLKAVKESVPTDPAFLEKEAKEDAERELKIDAACEDTLENRVYWYRKVNTLSGADDITTVVVKSFSTWSVEQQHKLKSFLKKNKTLEEINFQVFEREVTACEHNAQHCQKVFFVLAQTPSLQQFFTKNRAFQKILKTKFGNVSMPDALLPKVLKAIDEGNIFDDSESSKEHKKS